MRRAHPFRFRLLARRMVSRADILRRIRLLEEVLLHFPAVLLESERAGPDKRYVGHGYARETSLAGRRLGTSLKGIEELRFKDRGE